jgi:hypothetical protein
MMSTKRVVLVAIIALLTLSCTCPLTSITREADSELARYTEPELIEEALESMLAPYHLEELEVYCSEAGVLIAFEPPEEIGIGRLQMLYLSLIDTATLQAPFVPSVVVVTKVGGTQAFALAAATENVKAWRRDEMTASELFKTFEICLPGFEPLEGSAAAGEATVPPAPNATAAASGVDAGEIIAQSVEVMNGVTSAHFVFEQEVVGGYTASGEGVLLLPDRAHFNKMSSYDEAPVETIVIGSTGYWADDSVSGGWNGGPIAPFASNPARWVELLRFHQKTLLLGEERVHKVECYHLWFNVTFEPGWLGLFSGEGTGEAWINRGDFSLVKAVYDVQYEGSRESGSMKLTFELSDLNDPVTIEAPR